MNQTTSDRIAERLSGVIPEAAKRLSGIHNHRRIDAETLVPPI
jgi:hypothetical protein